MELTNSVVYLFKKTILNPHTQEYANILCVNCIPHGNLAQYVHHINVPKVSEFSPYKNECIYAICKNINCKQDLMTIDDLPLLLIFFKQNNYVIHHSFNEIVNNHSHVNSHLFLFSHEP